MGLSMNQRDAAGSLQLELREGDSVQHMWGTADGLLVISRWRTCRVRTPDCIDPGRQHADAPWQQSIVFELGTESPLVARSLVQVQEILKRVFPESDGRRSATFDMAFRVLKALLTLDRILKRIRTETEACVEVVSASIEQYTVGQAPKPIPPILTLEEDFRSFALEVRQCLNHTTDLFELIDASVGPGRFDIAREKLKQKLGEDAGVFKMLEGDARWIDLWIVVANTVKHPKKSERVVVNELRLLANRQVQLPTWQLFHPSVDLKAPQALLESADIVIQNLLGLFENLFIFVIQEVLPSPPSGLQWFIDDIPATRRDPKCPQRYVLSIGMQDARRA